jgi:hypothetical protein
LHLVGLCVAEGLWIFETTPCETLSTDELRRRLQAGDILWWSGEPVFEARLLTPCACGAGSLLKKVPQVPPGTRDEAEKLWPITERVQARLANLVERWHAEEAELGQRLAAEGVDADTARRLREERAWAQELRERYQRVLAWISTAPQLSNDLVMATSFVVDDERRALPRGVRLWIALAGALAAISNVLRPKERRR